MKVLSVNNSMPSQQNTFGQITPKDIAMQVDAEKLKAGLTSFTKELDELDLSELTETPALAYARRLGTLIELKNRLKINFPGTNRGSA